MGMIVKGNKLMILTNRETILISVKSLTTT